MDKTFHLTVTGVRELEGMLKELPEKLERNVYLGFNRYIRKHLVKRMKDRLSKATQAPSKSHMGMDGIPRGGGGYGVPKNSVNYAAWKESRNNLPLIGKLSPRELVATGHFIESIGVANFTKGKGFFEFSVGPRPGSRPSVTPFQDDSPGQAKVNKIIENTQLAEWIEDSKYAWLVTEFEDVQREVVPLVLHILKITIRQLANRYFNKVSTRV